MSKYSTKNIKAVYFEVRVARWTIFLRGQNGPVYCPRQHSHFFYISQFGISSNNKIHTFFCCPALNRNYPNPPPPSTAVLQHFRVKNLSQTEERLHIYHLRTLQIMKITDGWFGWKLSIYCYCYSPGQQKKMFWHKKPRFSRRKRYSPCLQSCS